jgi:hypothetical protein
VQETVFTIIFLSDFFIDPDFFNNINIFKNIVSVGDNFSRSRDFLYRNLFRFFIIIGEIRESFFNFDYYYYLFGYRIIEEINKFNVNLKIISGIFLD